MFYATRHPVRRLAAFAQIVDEAGVARGLAPEAGRRHASAAQEDFDATQCGHDLAGSFCPLDG
jgi:hypothetical protein